jgi:DNA polymerase-3 subunit alpha
MGKKKPEVLAKEFEKFWGGMKANGYSRDACDTLWGVIEPFASYAFNKSHAAGYGLVSYWTAYLKANYTAEYMAALLTSVADRKDKSAIYLSDCRHLGISVLSPDVNESLYNFLPVGKDIRFGLGAVRNVGEDVVNSIVEARESKGLFKDFSDYLDKIDTVACNKRVTDSLIKAGAFDSMGHPRKGLVLVAEDAVDAVISTKKAADKGQFDLFAGFGGEESPVDNVFAVQVPDAEFDRKQQLALERDMIGLYVSGHPLDGFEEALDAQTDTPLTTILSGELRNGAEVTIGGIISGVDRRVSKKDGSPWAIVTIEDHHGASVELLVFAKVYSLVAQHIVEDNIIVAKAHVSIRDERMSLFCDFLDPAELGPGNGAGLPLRLTMRTEQCTKPNIAKLKEVLLRNKGESDVYLNLVCGEETSMMILGDHLRVNKSASLMGDLKATMGPGILG